MNTSLGVRLFLALAASILPLSASAWEPTKVVPDQYLVQRVPQTLGRVTQVTKSYLTVRRFDNFDVVDLPKVGARKQSTVGVTESAVIDHDKVAKDCSQIMLDPTVMSCEPNLYRRLFVFPNDPSFSSQWYLEDPVSDSDINIGAAWDQTTGSTQTIAGVIDSGIYYQHPDLVPNLWSNPNDPVDGVDNDGNGYVDDVFGVSTVYGDNIPQDYDGHGTHVSGIIGARGNNSVGVSGVNWQVSLVVASIADVNGNLTLAAIIAAYDYFYNLKRRGHNIRVINASYGGSQFSPAEFAAVSRLNDVDILLVAAAGNESTNNDIFPSYPCDLDLPNVISVGATGPTAESASYSNYGESVDIAAPGGDQSLYGNSAGILSTYSPLAPGGASYLAIQGTSMAAPVVTGAIVLLSSQRPYLSGSRLKEILFNTADEWSSLQSLVSGSRFINVSAMLSAPDPADSCPSDPNKIDPGICGCGVEENFTDSDGDNTSNCVDGCPSDPNKTSAGSCGCGVSDTDLNLNDVPDCIDPDIRVKTPNPPTITVSGKRVRIQMQQAAGVTYSLEVKIAPPRGRSGGVIRTVYSGTSSVRSINKPTRGKIVSARYRWKAKTGSRAFSRWSSTTKRTI